MTTEDTPVSERKWTKGPWYVGREYGAENLRPAIQIKRDVTYVEGTRPTTYLVGEVTYPTTTGNTVGAEERRANAYLVAAAPDLYEALAELVADAGWAHMTDDQLKYEAELGNEMVLSSIKARAALKRADGEVGPDDARTSP